MSAGIILGFIIGILAGKYLQMWTTKADMKYYKTYMGVCQICGRKFEDGEK